MNKHAGAKMPLCNKRLFSDNEMRLVIHFHDGHLLLVKLASADVAVARLAVAYAE
jgi:hypothetical protein